jgi:heme/copper-type cytochrome/quinol oxidase subunit 2
MYSRRRFLFAALTLVAGKAAGQDHGPSAPHVSVVAKRYTFEPRRIDVQQDDLVRIELRTLDIAHSMTIDAYRIAKRVSPGAPVTFEFRADQAGTFPFYCNLQIDEGCRQMRGELVVRPRRQL